MDAFIKALMDGAPRELSPGDMTLEMILERANKTGAQFTSTSLRRRISALVKSGFVDVYDTIVSRGNQKPSKSIAYHFNAGAWKELRSKPRAK